MSRTFKHVLSLSALAVAVLSASLAHAQPYSGYPGWEQMPQDDFGPGGYPWEQRAEQNSPADALRDGVQKLTRFLDGKPNRGALEAYLNRSVAPWFDFDYMAEWAVGRRIRFMDNAQRNQMTAQLRASFLDKMAQKLARYSRQRAVFMPVEQDDYDQVTLPVAIENPEGGYPARLEFHMRRTPQGWKVIDVSANGMSALVYYREMFADMQMQMQRSRPPLPQRPY